jgi:hypothetical protein
VIYAPCIITATLPRMYLSYLHDKIKNLNSIPPRFNATARHKVKLLSNPINHSEIIGMIVGLSKKETNVLIIVNTVKFRIKNNCGDLYTTTALLIP